MADVFISYAREDQAIAKRVAKALEAAGLDVWSDAELPAHRAYSEVIERNLAEAKAVVVLWSAAAAHSQWVRAEADFARNAGKLVQARVDGTLPPMPFNQIQCADLKGWRGNPRHAGWAKLRASVQALVSGEEQPTAALPQPRRRAWLHPYGWAVAATLVLIVAAGLFFTGFGVPGEQRKPVVAVLPFRSLDPHDASLVAGIWEDTRTAIGRNPQLVVLGPNTAEQLAQKGEGAARKAADYLVEASVRTAGDRIRVSTDLVRTKDGEQLWSQDFDRKLDDVFALQSEIASEIEGRIRGRLAEKGGITPEHIATSGEVYALYSDARAKLRKRDFDAYPAIRDQLQQVLRMDPNFAPAWAELAEVGGAIRPSQNSWKIENNAEAYARKAIDLAPNLAAGHAALALALKLRGPIARAEIERAVQLDPNDYEALSWLATMRSDAGDKKGAIDAFRRAAQIEPFFWPAVFNLYSTLRDVGDRPGMEELVRQENRLGADYLGTAVQIDDADKRGNLAQAANVGLAYWKTGRKEGRAAVGFALWTVLLQLGFFDEAARLGPVPPFGPVLWRNDPKGLDMMEAQKIDTRTFFSLEPLTENAGRVYLLSGRGRKLADMYLSLKLSPEAFEKLAVGDGPEHFLYSAPLIAVALRESGHESDATALLSLAETRAQARQSSGRPLDAVLLARVYSVEGRKDDAIALLASAINRGWIPEPPEIMVDLNTDPALAPLKGDPRFEALRDRITGMIARERAQVNLSLLPQPSSA